jgi:hypothetical protein
MWRDPIVEEVRRIREEYAAQFNYDLWAMHRDLQEKEKQRGRKVVSFPPKPAAFPVVETPEDRLTG